MLTFTQRELPHVSAVTMAGGSSGEAKLWQDKSGTSSFTSCSYATVSFYGEKRKRKKRGSENRVSKQRRYAVSKHKTMVSGVAVVCLLFSGPDSAREQLKGLEQRRTEGIEGWPSLSLGKRRVCVCVCANRGGYLKGGGGLTDHNHD